LRVGRYVLYRLAAAVPVVFGVTLLVFFMVRLVPGDPVDAMFRDVARPTAEQRAALRRELGIDRPLPEQYARFLWRALHGDLGRSFRSKQPVTEEILSRMPNTIRLAFAGLAVAVVFGGIAGTMAAVARGTWVDGLSMVTAVLAVSVPGFWLGLMAILLFSVRLGWFPVAGASTWRHVVLPAGTLGVLTAAVLARMVRSSMLDALAQDYVRTARAKGVREGPVVLRHALRNAAIPIVTILGLEIGGLLSGAFIIEAVFAYPGVGLLAVNALQTRDFPVIQGIVLLTALIYVAVNLAVDVLYGVIDPRVGYR
jgi:ABC-type dipeptide/oligopeptide/nickel transport system permease component